jgi:hypothetical protein
LDPTVWGVIKNSAQLKKPINLVQKQVDWLFHLNTVVDETLKEKNNSQRKKKRKWQGIIQLNAVVC